MFAANTLMRPVTWPATGSRVVGVAVGSAGGKSRSWARAVQELVGCHRSPIAVDMDRGRLVGEPRRSDRVGALEFEPEASAGATSRGVGCGTEYVPAGNVWLPTVIGVVVVTGP